MYKFGEQVKPPPHTHAVICKLQLAWLQRWGGLAAVNITAVSSPEESNNTFIGAVLYAGAVCFRKNSASNIYETSYSIA